MRGSFKYILFLFLCFITSNMLAQSLEETEKLSAAQELCLIIVSKIETPEVSYAPVEKPLYWKNGVLTQLGFSQVSLTNWAAGGDGSISMNAFVDMSANYRREKLIWENRMTMAYGFIQTFGDLYKKSDDKWALESKFGYRAVDRLYMSALFNFRTQFTPGFEYPTAGPKKVSQFFAPAYMSLGLGVDYKPFKVLSINFAPVTGNLVFVSIKELRTKYGNKEDEAVRKEFGAQLKMEYKQQFKNVKLESSLSLFSDFLNNPQNLQVYWNVAATVILNKYFTSSIRTNLIYDDNIKIANKDGVLAARVQFKEIFSVNFAYTIGNYEKKK